MALSEFETAYSLPPTFVVKKPTVEQMISILENHGEEPQTALLTFIGEPSPNEINYDVIDSRRSKEILHELKKFDPADKLLGEIIFHRLPKL